MTRRPLSPMTSRGLILMAEQIAAATPMGGHPKDYHAAKMGMWLFLFTEILLFGGLFLLYASYRHKFPQAFHAGGQTLDVFLGGLNTVVLITSSLSVALSITALRRGELARCLWLLSFTIACAAPSWSTRPSSGWPSSTTGSSPAPSTCLGCPRARASSTGCTSP